MVREIDFGIRVVELGDIVVDWWFVLTDNPDSIDKGTVGEEKVHWSTSEVVGQNIRHWIPPHEGKAKSYFIERSLNEEWAVFEIV